MEQIKKHSDINKIAKVSPGYSKQGTSVFNDSKRVLAVESYEKPARSRKKKIKCPQCNYNFIATKKGEVPEHFKNSYSFNDGFYVDKTKCFMGNPKDYKGINVQYISLETIYLPKIGMLNIGDVIWIVVTSVEDQKVLYKNLNPYVTTTKKEFLEEAAVLFPINKIIEMEIFSIEKWKNGTVSINNLKGLTNNFTKLN